MPVRSDLPTYYYVEHFLEMLDFVARVYDAMLLPSCASFIAEFRALPRPAQCLYVRMANRRGAVFALPALDYTEIGDAGQAAARLVAAGFARDADAGDAPDILSRMAKPALLALARAGDIAVKSSWPKARLADALAVALPVGVIETDGHLVRERRDDLDFILFLYFGRCESDLKSFALRDLGIVAVHARQDFSARFETGAEAAACFTDSRWLQQLRAAPEACAGRCVAYLAAAGAPPTAYNAELRAKVAHAAGQYYERAGDEDAALAAYRHGASPDCHERRVRLLHASGQHAAAKLLLEQMLDDPASDSEHDFASDFHARKFGGKRTGPCTELLQGAGRIVVDEAFRQNPEQGAATYFRRSARAVHHAENHLWQQLFGLLFWDELFGERARLGSSFDALPPCLKDGSFLTLHGAEIEAKLAAVRAGAALPLVLRTIAGHWGKPNGLVHWPSVPIEALTDLLRGHGDALAAMVRAMATDYAGCRDGFPDLLVVGDDGLRFVEVKTAGDALRRNQLTRLRQLRRAGFAAEICGVDYRFDPGQTYVVVDIETTGGRAGAERVTEIGAVKIRDHHIVGEWQTLLNPQKRIPGTITRLTGISDAMVRDAPLFADIANDFAGFMEDGVFVAHNVNFDYGFLSAEYRRLERPFRYPKFCTCAEMRRHYPGHASYSLANLCATYDIDLTGHHRAMNDARAAAQLLGLINRRRAG